MSRDGRISLGSRHLILRYQELQKGGSEGAPWGQRCAWGVLWALVGYFRSAEPKRWVLHSVLSDIRLGSIIFKKIGSSQDWRKKVFTSQWSTARPPHLHQQISLFHCLQECFLWVEAEAGFLWGNSPLFKCRQNRSELQKLPFHSDCWGRRQAEAWGSLEEAEKFISQTSW